MDGWIKLHRKLLDNPVVMKDADHLAVWTYLLLNASHKEHRTLLGGKPVILKPGQLVTGRKKIGDALNVNEHKIDRVLKALKSEHMIEQQGTRHGSVISILRWNEYQDSEQQIEQQVSNKRATSEQQVSTIQECKNDKKNIYSPVCSEIIAYLNEKAGTHYRPNTAKTVSLIQARLREKFTADDFKVVIDKKVKEWRGTEMEKFLRPETLFGSKFEGYLNQTGTGNKPKSNVPRQIEPPKYREFEPEPEVDAVQMPKEIRDSLSRLF